MNTLIYSVRTALKNLLTHHMFKDSVAIGLAQILAIMIGMLLGVIIARSFSLVDMGRYQLVISYLAVANIIALPGMGPIISKGILKGYDPIFYTALKKSILATTSCSVVLLLSGGVLYFLDIAMWPGMIMMVIGVFLPILGIEKYESFFKGKRDFILSRKIMVLGALVNLLVVGCAAWFSKSVFVVVLTLFFCRASVNCFCLWLIKGRIIHRERVEVEEASLLKQGWGLSFLSVFNMSVGQIDRIILGVMNPQLLAIYHIGSVLPKRIKDNVKIFLVVPMTHWAKFSAEGYYKKVKEHWAKFVALGVVLAGMIWATAPFLIIFLYGEKYYEAIFVARIISLILPVIFIGNVIINQNIYQGDTRFYRKMTVCTQVFYLIVLAILVPRYGIYGVMWSIVARSYVQNVACTGILVYINKRNFAQRRVMS